MIATFMSFLRLGAVPGLDIYLGDMNGKAGKSGSVPPTLKAI
jgi:hypothetical protein